MGFSFSFLRRRPYLSLQHEIYPLQGPNISNRGLRCAVYKAGCDLYISECIRRYGIWEPTESAYLIDNLKPGDTYIDIGANIGYHTLLASSLVGDTGRVISYEPDEKNFAFLKYNISLNSISNVTAINAAVSDRAGPSTMYRSPDNMGDHRLWGDASMLSFPTNVQMLDPANVSEKTIIKIDVQVWESKVILGNLDAICRARSIIFEFLPLWVQNNADDPILILETFADRCFDLFLVKEEARKLEPVSLDYLKSVTAKMIEDGSFIDIIAERRSTA